METCRYLLAALLCMVQFNTLHADCIDLNGSWDFAFKENANEEQICTPEFVGTDVIVVPGCFDAMAKWSKKRGVAQYRKRFYLPHDVQNAWLKVEGMGLRGAFYIDGNLMGKENLPYSTFQLPTGKLKEGWHIVYAVISNMLDETDASMFHQYYDFYAFGGFYHGVSLELQNDKAGFYKVQVRTKNYKTGQVELELLAHQGFATENMNAKVWFDEAKTPISLKFNKGKALATVPDAKLWSTAHPTLHTVKVEVDGVQQTARFGIREVKTEGTKILLNGEVIQLRGANRHETYPTLGNTTPDAIMMQDLQHIKALGGNFVRGAHYPQCNRFLELCDEMGILVWEESLGWNNKVNHMTNKEFIVSQKRQLQIMVEESLNHPSVIITGFLNENRSNTKEAYQLIEQLVQLVKNEDTGHLITFACNEGLKDTCNELVDIVSFNTYPGWIGTQAGSSSNLRKIVKENVDKLVHHFSKRYPNKPILVSEMGTCGIYGMRDVDAAQWTEDFQSEYMEAVLMATMNNPRLMGLCIWQLNDSPSFYRDGGTIRTKPFAMNLAGLYDEYRRPKLAAQTINKYWK